MSSISSSLAKFNDQLAGLVKLMKFSLKERYRGEVSDATADLHASLMGGKYIPPIDYDKLRKMPKEGILRSPSGRSTSSGSTSARASGSSTRSAARVHMPSWMPNFLAPDHETPKARAKRGAQPLYKNQLVKWGAGYALMQLADEIAAAAG